MKLTDILILIIDVVVTSYSDIILKKAVHMTKRINKIFFTLMGFGLYFLMSFLSVYLYSQYSLVFIQILLTMTYILAPLMAHYFLKEKLPSRTWICLIFIIIGITLVSLGENLIK